MGDFEKPVSNSQSLLVKCPHCAQSGSFEVWQRITSSTDEYATNMLLKGELFKYTCPTCNATTSMVYDCLYHDVNRRAFLLLSNTQDEKKSVSLLRALQEKQDRESPHLEYSKDDIPIAGTPSFRFDRYQVRLATNAFEFFEKARIWNEGYDDRVIELMKIAIKRGMLKEGIIGPDDTMIYERTMPDGGISFVVVGDIPGDSVGVPQGYDYCKTYLEEGEILGALEGEYRFDSNWAKNYLP